MTNREITDRYLKYKGMTRTKPESLGFQPILPFYVMDVVYEIYCKYVMPLPAARELKKAKNEWRDAYNLLDRDFHRQPAHHRHHQRHGLLQAVHY